jgi:hypothetical protein
MTQTTVHLTNSVLEEPIDNGVPAPKFTPGQSVTFQLALTISAVIDGEAEWDEEEGEYLYAVTDTKYLGCPEDIYLDEVSLAIDEVSSIIPEEKMRHLHRLLTVAKDRTPDLPSCEFDPN